MERIGTTTYGMMFPEYGANDCIWIDWYYGCDDFRCYEDADLFYGTSDSCVYILSALAPTALAKPTLVVMPNPIGQAATVVLPLFGLEQYTDWQLFDISGNLVLNQAIAENATTATIDTRGVSNGIYILAFSNRNGVVVQRCKVALCAD